MTEKKNAPVFVINEFLTLKLEGKKTHIYVAGQKFQQCIFLLIDIPVEDISSFDEIESIDAAAEKLDHSLHPHKGQSQFVYDIPAKVEFWGHCSNLQVWAENGYNSKLLHMNLAFPLLRELARVGDPQANKVFKEEIIKRYNSGIDTVRKYLRSMDFLNYLSVEEFVSLIESEKERDALYQLRKMFPMLEEPVIPVERGGRNPLDIKIDIKNGKILKLNLAAVGMERVPKCLLDLSSLENLNLSDNLFKELPNWIGELKSLRVLKIAKSNLKKLPEGIESLQNLIKLNIQGNQLESLPNSIGNLKSLRILELYKNNLRALPESIGNLRKLETLALYENKLINLHTNIGLLKNLKVLTISENMLYDLPPSIRQLQNLRFLTLDSNEFRVLPASIGGLKNLEILHASQNPLVRLDQSIYSLPNLKDFWLLDVPIEEKLVKETNFSGRWARIHYRKREFENEDEKKKKEAELIKYQEEMEINRKKLEAEESKKEKELTKTLSDVYKLIEKEEYRSAEGRLGDIIREAKRYHLNVIEQNAKKKLSDIISRNNFKKRK